MTQQTSPRARPICVVVDTNTWRSSFMLRSGLGTALLHIMVRTGGRLGLPYVVESEIPKHLRYAATEAVDAIRRSFRTLQIVIGSHRPYEVPGDNAITSAIQARIAELEPLLLRVPLTLEQTERALVRVNEERPPNATGKQQFKDSLIWEAVLELAQQYDVHLITNDSGFFDDKARSVPAAALTDELGRAGLSVCIHKDLEQCLAALQYSTPPINREALAQLFVKTMTPELDKEMGRQNVELREFRSFEVSPFLTENHDVLAFSCRMSFGAVAGSNDWHDVQITIEGEGRYSIRQNAVLDGRLDRVLYEWTDAAGARQQRKSAYAYIAPLFIGEQPDVPFSLRRPLP